MRLKLSVFIGCVLCVVLVGVYGVLSRVVDSRDGWRPSDVYSSVGGYSYSTVSYSSASHVSGGLGSPSMRSSNPMLRRRVVSSYAPAVNVSAYSQYPIAGAASNNSAGASALYTTSSAEFRSFGGGLALGGAAFNGAGKAATSSVVAASTMNVSMPSTSAYVYNADRNNSVAVPNSLASYVSGEMAVSSLPYAGIGNTTGGASKGISGRKNAPGMGGNLDNWIQDIIGNDGWVWSDGTIDYFDKEKLYQMYLDAIANKQLPEGMSWEEFLSWFGDQGDRYAFPIPSGVWFMCFLALGYGLYIAYRRKQKVVNS